MSGSLDGDRQMHYLEDVSITDEPGGGVLNLNMARVDDPIKKLARGIIYQALREGATSLNFQTTRDQVSMRYCVNGAFYEMAPIPRDLSSPVTRELELMFGVANEVPQPLTRWQRFRKVVPNMEVISSGDFMDGDSVSRETVMQRSKEYKRVVLNFVRSTTDFGKQYNLKLFYHGKDNFIDVLNEHQKQGLEELMESRSGLLLVVAGQGMGKTSICYDLLLQKGQERNIQGRVFAVGRTAVPPGDIQTIGMGIGNPKYPGAVRGIREFNPSLVVFDDIHDEFTAQEALSLANNGTFVVASVCAHDLKAGLDYFRSFDIDSGLFAKSLRGLIGQTLVRNIHEGCKTEQVSNDELLGDFQGQKLYFGKGCPGCNCLGYVSRIPLVQFLDRRQIHKYSVDTLIKSSQAQTSLAISLGKPFHELAKPLVLDGKVDEREYYRLKLEDSVRNI
ncbi:MAG: hypothetical protein AABX11_03770 [Nanoarchaeota archaeon]